MQALIDLPDNAILVATLYSNERPLQGLAGLLDWHLNQAITPWVRSGSVVGQPGELSLIPTLYRKKPLSILLIGAGTSVRPGDRKRLSAEALGAAAQAVRRLKASHVAGSAFDLGATSQKECEAAFSGLQVHWLPV